MEEVNAIEDDDKDTLQNEFNPFDPVWGVLYRATLSDQMEVPTKCLEKMGTLAALTFASDKLNSIGMTILYIVILPK